jgi:hypothetical protein
MGKLPKIVLCAIGSTVALGLLHAWLNLGFDPARAGAGCLSLFPLGPCNSLGSFSVLYSLPEARTMPVSAGST